MRRSRSDIVQQLALSRRGGKRTGAGRKPVGQPALGRGMKGLLVRLAKALDRAWERRGRVIRDRYHARVPRTPREVRRALVYALHNAKKHGARILGIDAFSSGPWFEGWADRSPRADRPLPRPDSWLLSFGWTKGGLISAQEIPCGGTEWEPADLEHA